jgi:hypothetical protein
MSLIYQEGQPLDVSAQSESRLMFLLYQVESRYVIVPAEGEPLCVSTLPATLGNIQFLKNKVIF